MEHHHLQGEHSLQLAIFNSYVELPNMEVRQIWCISNSGNECVLKKKWIELELVSFHRTDSEKKKTIVEATI